MKRIYTPERGDIIWLDFNPQRGHEQAHRRPALVLSPKLYNEKSNLAFMCPITTKLKKHPFEVMLTVGKTRGAVLCDQLKSLDWHARNAVFIERVPMETMNEVQASIIKLLTE